MTNACGGPVVLDAQVALVTGAAQGLGAAIARGLAAAGAAVALTDLRPAAAEAVAQEIEAAGGRAMALALDVRSEAAFDAAFAAVLKAWGRVDILVNNAARTESGSPWSIDAAQWDELMAVNLRGCFFGCRIAGAHMRARGTGRIINLASLAGQQPSPATGVHYAASKAGILALTRGFAEALAPHGVTVNALAPAAIEGPALGGLDAAAQAALRARVPLGRFGRAEEVAAAAVYLASPAAAFMTGATLDLNGGRFMR